MSYQEARNVRREARTLVGRFRGGKLAPVMAVAVRGNEGGFVSQKITYELDPIAGRMVTPIYGEMTSVFVPVQAMDAIRDPEAAYAGMTEVIREKLLSGNPLFGLEPEGEISKRCGVNPRSIDGVKKVSEAVRLAHNAAVNFLRQRKYVKASTVLASNTAITPALISQTVLERLNGVLDPDDRVNGMVVFDSGPVTSPELQPRDLPLKNTYFGATSSTSLFNAWGGSGGTADARPLFAKTAAAGSASTNTDDKVFAMPAIAFPDVATALEDLHFGSISLSDLYTAERMDKITRALRRIVDDNPEYGEEMALRYAHGLSVDSGKMPFVISEQRRAFGRSLVGATDTGGVQSDVMRSDMMLEMSFNVPVPRTELGGIIITFCSVKPDETISSQPHPFLSDVWGLDNFVADELAIDPVPVTIRELDSDCAAAQESTVALYTGLNQLKALYVHYGLSRALDPTTVENKTAVWQLEVPMSVTPDSILYPETLSQYPFADQAAEVCTYVVTSNVVMRTPMIIGPTPVEELAVIDDKDIFEEEA